mgnify:CR=1 FL=1
MKRTMIFMLGYITTGFLHFGWAIWGETCDCGISNFNRLALFFQRFDSRTYEKWGTDEPNTVVADVIVIGSVRFAIGNFFTNIAQEIDNRIDSIDLQIWEK